MCIILFGVEFMYNEEYMKMAIEEAKKALNDNEVPIGAVIVREGKVISRSYNQKNRTNMVTRHAEINAIEDANRVLGNWRLNECDMYVTLEPCPMCMSAIQQARIQNVYYGIRNRDDVNASIIDAISKKTSTNPGVNVVGGYMEEKIKILLTSFFKKRRQSNYTLFFYVSRETILEIRNCKGRIHRNYIWKKAKQNKEFLEDNSGDISVVKREFSTNYFPGNNFGDISVMKKEYSINYFPGNNFGDISFIKKEYSVIISREIISEV